MIRYICCFIISFFIFSSCADKTSSKRNPDIPVGILKKYDSLRSKIRSSGFSPASLEKQILTIGNDSLENELSFVYTYYHYRQGDSLEFRKWNNKTFHLSISLKDTSKIAEAHWDLANFLHDRNYTDSSFYHYNRSQNLYNSIQDHYHTGIMLLNMGIIQREIKDYSGSEVTTVRAIEILEPLGKMNLLYMAYNNLGIVYNELGEYSMSLEYHNAALEYQKKLSNPVQHASSLNNIGVVHKNGQKYNKAQNYFEQALAFDSLSHKNPRLYAMLLDNLAHARLLNGDTFQVKELFLEALGIRERIGHEAGITINKIHLAEYHLNWEDTLTAKKFILEAKNLAEEVNNHRDLLSSLLILSKIDRSNSENHLHHYITLNDSLQRKERAVRNKFARIQFETNRFIAENQYLSEQRKWIIGGAGSALLILLLVFIIWRQKGRNKKLALEQEQQRANEEIYNLLLVQQNKLEEGRHLEKERISKELHDGVLGKLFGTRLMLENVLEHPENDFVESRKKYLNELRFIEKEIRCISHDLSSEFLSPKQNFIDVLEEYLRDQKKIGKFEIDFECDEQISWDKLINKIKINLFRVVQEAINNINKYAEANHVIISFKEKNNSIEVLIRDNGKGFRINDRQKGIGLKNIQSRVKSLNGIFKLSSGKEGTSLELKVPLKYSEND